MTLPSQNHATGQAHSKRRVALLGAGHIADWHAQSIRSVAGVELVAVCDQFLARAQALARKFGIPRAYPSLDAMLAAENRDGDRLEAVHVLLPPDCHFDAAKTLLEADVAVLLEKPMCDRAANCVTLAALAFWAGPILHVWLGPALPVRDTLVPLFVVFSLAMQMHMLTGAGTSILRGMGRVYEEFSYSIPNLLFLAVMLLAARWIEGRWTPFGIGAAVCLATACSACVLMGRVLWVLDLRLTSFLRAVILPGVTPYLVAGALAWPVALLVAQVNRWQGASVLLAAGLPYAAGGFAVLNRWVLTDEEKHKGLELACHGLGVFRRREVGA